MGGQRWREAWAVYLHGRIAEHHSSDIHEAGTHYREALAFAAALDMPPFVAHCHLGLGNLYHRTGDSERVREHLSTATTMYREMGMTFWLEKAAATLRSD